MSKRRLLPCAAAGAALVLAVSLAWVWARRGAPEAADTTAAPPWSAWTEPGAATTYRFAYRAHQGDQHLTGAPGRSDELAGGMQLAGALQIDGPAPGEARHLTALRFVEIEDAELRLLGRAALPTAAAARQALVGHPVWLELTAQGAIAAVHHAADTPELCWRTLEALALEAQVVRAEDDRAHYQVDERSPRGELVASYQRQKSANGVRLDKRIERYGRVAALAALGSTPAEVLVDGAAAIELDPDGRLLTLRREETLLAEALDERPLLSATSALTLSRVGATPSRAAPPDLAGLVRTRPGELSVSAEAEAQGLRDQAGELSGERLLADLRLLGGGGRMPNHNRWLAQATARLRLEPGLCHALGELFTDNRLGSAGRALVLDLLVAAGTPDAQRALLTALASDATARDPGAGALWQRLAFVRQPEPQTLDAAAQAYLTADGPLRAPLALALGALVGNAARGGDPASASEAHERLRAELEAAATPAERALLARALGNAGLADDVELLAGLARAPEGEVRAAVATALRKSDAAAAAETLLDLAADRDPTVQGAALASLAARPLDDAGLTALGRLVTDGRLFDANADALVTLLTRYPASPIPRQIFALMLARGPLRSELEARLRTLLE